MGNAGGVVEGSSHHTTQDMEDGDIQVGPVVTCSIDVSVVISRSEHFGLDDISILACLYT